MMQPSSSGEMRVRQGSGPKHPEKIIKLGNGYQVRVIRQLRQLGSGGKVCMNQTVSRASDPNDCDGRNARNRNNIEHRMVMERCDGTGEIIEGPMVTMALSMAAVSGAIDSLDVCNQMFSLIGVPPLAISDRSRSPRPRSKERQGRSAIQWN